MKVLAWVRRDQTRLSLFFGASFLSAGCLPLACFYYPLYKIRLTCVECSPYDADFVIVEHEDELRFTSVSINETDKLNHDNSLIVIELDCFRYYTSSREHFIFRPVAEVPVGFRRYLSLCPERQFAFENWKQQQKVLKVLYGLNHMHIEETGFAEVAIRIMLSPFYLFQYFAWIVWIVGHYYLYTLLLIIITISAIYLSTAEILSNLQHLRTLAGVHNEVLRISHPNSFHNDTSCDQQQPELRSMDDRKLIPGMHFVINEQMTLPCDAVLLSGKVIVDEAMLTGESIPVTKTPFDTSDINSNTLLEGEIAVKRSGSVLFGGTKVIAIYGEPVIAVVYRTAFRSAKGQLIASLLKPREAFMSFVSDAMRVIIAMLCFATFIYFAMVVFLIKLGASAYDICYHYLEVLTIAVPPAMTACLTVATSISVNRLKERKKIFISDTNRVNFAGVIHAVCFDKTGTLTEDRLTFHSCFSVITTNAPDSMQMIKSEANNLPFLTQLVMATCHGLSLYTTASNSSYNYKNNAAAVGDPLEVELLHASGWSLHNGSNIETANKLIACPKSDKQQSFVIYKHFEFSPDKLRAASIVYPLHSTDEWLYLVKGSPEKILQMCNPRTIPDVIQQQLRALARDGLRVIAIAYRPLSSHISSSCTQEQCEEEESLTFLGLLALSNPLKADTKRTINLLQQSAGLHVAMITGDNIFTAVAIARSCGILGSRTLQQQQLIIDANDVDQVIVVDYHTGEMVVEEVTEEIMNQIIYHAALATFCSFHPHLLAATANINPLHHTTATTNNAFVISNTIELAVTGRGLHAIQQQSPELYPFLIRYAKVFARTKPHEKKAIVEVLQSFPEFDLTAFSDIFRPCASPSFACRSRRMRRSVRYDRIEPRSNNSINLNTLESQRDNSDTDSDNQNSSKNSANNNADSNSNMKVIFCGDGANDMIALRAATVGISLCDAETSVAAPITSKYPTPSAVVSVILEGRCSLVTAYCLVLFNIMYGSIQLLMVCQLYYFGLLPGDYMYLQQDLFYTLVLGIAISYTEPMREEDMSKRLPPERFLTRYFLLQLGVMLLLIMSFQALSLVLLTVQSWYSPNNNLVAFTETYSYEASTLQIMALSQLMIASIVSSIGPPFRRPWIENKYHVIALVLQGAWLLFQLFAQNNSFLQNILQVKPLPVSFCGILLALMILQAIVCVGLVDIINTVFLPVLSRRWFDQDEVKNILSGMEC